MTNAAQLQIWIRDFLCWLFNDKMKMSTNKALSIILFFSHMFWDYLSVGRQWKLMLVTGTMSFFGCTFKALLFKK